MQDRKRQDMQDNFDYPAYPAACDPAYPVICFSDWILFAVMDIDIRCSPS